MMDVLDEPVLVLNKNWQYIAVTTAREALSSLYTEASTAVDPESYALYTFEDWVERGVKPGKPFLHGVHIDFEVPEVIILVEFDKALQKTLRYSKHAVFTRDKHTCQYCGLQLTSKLTIDHVIPRSQNGVTKWTNCVACCERCNTKKADRTPEQAGMRLKKQPVKPSDNLDIAIHRLRVRKPAWAKFI